MGEMDRTFNIRFLREKDFDEIIKLDNRVFRNNYLTPEIMNSVYKKSIKDGRNCSFTLTVNEGNGKEVLIGFILTYAPGQWLDSYDSSLELSSDMWEFDTDKVAYMKYILLDTDFRGLGFGRMLLDRAVSVTKRMGAEAAVSHVWTNSQENSNYNYYTRAGGRTIKLYPRYWSAYHGEDKPCGHCGVPCECPAVEMIIDYSTYKELGHV